MFRGSVPASMQQIVGEITNGWDCNDIYVGCSGNFTIERILNRDRFNLHSNDVTIYSYVLGSYFAGKEIEISLKEEFQEGELSFLSEYIKDDEDKVATIMLCTKFLDGLGKEGNIYYERINKAYREQWDKMHGKTKEKLLNNNFNISSYENGDVVDWLLKINKDGGVISFPPFFANDYKNMFANIEKVFNWKEPNYEELTDERKKIMLDEIQDFKYWLIGLNFKMDELSDYLIGITKTTNRGVPIYLYGTSDTKRIVMPNQKLKDVRIERLGEFDDLGEKLEIAILDYNQFQALRSVYMNRYINPGQASLAVAVLVDGLLVGVYAFLSNSTYINYKGRLETPHIYLLSDFPIAPTKYKHLAKLVLYAALSKESKLIAEGLTKKRVRSLVTTAFSNNPVSMKYRGLFNLIDRKELDIDKNSIAHDNQKYQLNYGARMGDWTLEEGFELWKKKYGKKG